MQIKMGEFSGRIDLSASILYASQQGTEHLLRVSDEHLKWWDNRTSQHQSSTVHAYLPTVLGFPFRPGRGANVPVFS